MRNCARLICTPSRVSDELQRSVPPRLTRSVSVAGQAPNLPMVKSGAYVEDGDTAKRRVSGGLVR